jgi:hypothetical protein
MAKLPPSLTVLQLLHGAARLFCIADFDGENRSKVMMQAETEGHLEALLHEIDTSHVHNTNSNNTNNSPAAAAKSPNNNHHELERILFAAKELFDSRALSIDAKSAAMRVLLTEYSSVLSVAALSNNSFKPNNRSNLNNFNFSQLYSNGNRDNKQPHSGVTDPPTPLSSLLNSSPDDLQQPTESPNIELKLANAQLNSLILHSPPINSKQISENSANNDENNANNARKRKLPAFLANINSSERDNLAPRHLPSEDSENHDSKMEYLPDLPFLQFPGTIIYLFSASEVESTAHNLLRQLQPANSGQNLANSKPNFSVVGFDIEWEVTYIKGQAPRKAALLQLCTVNNNCYLLHIYHSGITPSLREILENSQIHKVGVNIRGDMRKLLMDYECLPAGCVDLSEFANLLQISRSFARNWSLCDLCELYLKQKLAKPQELRCSQWNNVPLATDQQRYAALDAFAAVKLYEIMTKLAKLQGKIEPNPLKLQELNGINYKQALAEANKNEIGSNNNNNNGNNNIDSANHNNRPNNNKNQAQVDGNNTAIAQRTHSAPNLSPNSLEVPSASASSVVSAACPASPVVSPSLAAASPCRSPVVRPRVHLAVQTQVSSVIPQVPEPKTLSQTALEVHKLWANTHYSVGDIAALRNVKISTVEEQLAAAILAGYSYDWRKLEVKEAEMDLVKLTWRNIVHTTENSENTKNNDNSGLQVYESFPSNMAALKEKLPSSMNYGHIKLILAHLIRTSAMKS